ncbi:meiosis protein SPO22/ZIP4 like-domain-containing protein [Fusarium sp. MPI-SDFR-AT-0072]|nr:meiosis protein SPO22/ZIP4 like-domain-containing protein [Fusarium sp. MPI-SDFR-AT-0072]
MTDRNAATMGKSAKQELAKGDDGKAVNRDKNSNATASGNHKAPTKKRRKVNHACVYCRRSERPCTRCIKRNIGHLCHDEPRDADSKKAKSVQSTQSIQAPSVVDESDAQSDMARSSISSTMGPPPPTFDTTRQRGSKSFGRVLGQGSPLSIVQPGQVSGLQGNALNNGNSNANQFAGFQDAWMTAQNHFHDMHSYHPNYMIASEVTHEFNLLNDFLHTSLLDDGSVPPEEQQSPAFKRSSQSQSEMLPRFGNNTNTSMGAGGSNTMSNMTEGSMLPPPPNVEGKNIPRPGSAVPADKAREYYLQAADPSGNDTPEERMARVLKAKYDAGLLKPFNYINGYSRLGAYLNSHITTASREKILRTIARFRPAFREKAHALTDIELVYVEMWFEKQLMDYDRVFASMAVPACCWRRTGEIFRGNKEMAELIGVSVAQLRDGKIALHEILTEESMVRYWEEFGTIAFDPAHETLLTACSLKNPTPGSTHPVVKCCFSFMIRRDEHKLKKKKIVGIGNGAWIQGFGAIGTEFATDLFSKLPTSCDSSSTDVLLSDLNHHITTANVLVENRIAPPLEVSRNLKDIGRKLWNECIKERRKRDNLLQSASRTRLLVRTRVLAFLALALAREHRRGKRRDDLEEIIYVMGLSLTLARVCVESSDLDGALLSMAKAADYVDRLKKIDNLTTEDRVQVQKIEAEYLTMRCALSWKQGRLDVAEHMYAKADDLLHNLDPSSAEHLADTFHGIGGDLLSRGDNEMALKWLRRALDLINDQALERLSTEGLELRISIHHELIQALLATGSQDGLQEAENLVSHVESEIGDKPVVLHWRLEILQRSPSEVFNADACASILRRMIRSLDLSDAGLGFLLHGISELRMRGPRLAIGLMDELLLRKLMPSRNMDWIGKSIVRRVWMGTMEADASVSVADLTQALDQLVQEVGQCDVEASTAALSQYKESQLWCQAALHSIFANSGEACQGKFSRRLVLCATSCSDSEAALSAFHSMPRSIQDEPLTRYLMFRFSLLNWDHDLGRQCVAFLGKFAEKSQCRDILYACIRDAQHVGDKLMTLEALKAVAETFDAEGSLTINLPSILRCTIRLIHSLESQEGSEGDRSPELAEETCQIFERAGEHAILEPKDEQGCKVFTVSELHWFRKNAYNIGVTKCHDDTDLRLMSVRCHFVVAAALISQARTGDKVDEQLQQYLETRRHISEFDTLFDAHFRNDPKSQIYPDLLAKLSTLFVFDFESAVFLKSWDDLSQIIRKARICKDEMMYKAMGDCLLRSEASGNVVYGTMRLIINEIFSLEQFDNQQLAKYMRCMFQAILPLDDNLAFQVVEQAVQIAREGSQMQKPFPAEDLDWIIATTFNHAIDILARGDEDLCQQWAMKALDLTEYMDDNGDMRDMLRERVVKLGLSKGAPS